jgi:hypothetical protein
MSCKRSVVEWRLCSSEGSAYHVRESESEMAIVDWAVGRIGQEEGNCASGVRKQRVAGGTMAVERRRG